MKKSLMVLGSVAAVALATPAIAATAMVPGSANPFLAGQPATTTCCGGDVVPADSPVLAPVTLTGGQVLTFSATGGVNYAGGAPATSADGDNDGTNYTFRYDMVADYGTGISGPLQVNVDGLVGVFLDGNTPTGLAPAQLDFSSGLNSTGLDFTSLTPGLDQIFWIGDGLTGLGTGSLQQFTVPTGATRLFLGTVDGSGWDNNSGSITVTINGATGAVPEPATWALMLAGFGVVGIALRKHAGFRHSLNFAI